MGLEVRVKSKPNKTNHVEIHEEEEPVTPAGRMFIQKKTSCCIICIVGVANPFEVEELKQGLMDSFGRHRRFSSIMNVNEQGRYIWVPTTLNIDQHVVVPNLSMEQRASPSCVPDYAAELAMAPELDLKKPLWEAHLINSDKNSAFTDSACIFRIHHSLGDGTSIMSLFLASTRKVNHPEQLPSFPRIQPPMRRANYLTPLWTLVLVLWYSVIEITRFFLVSFVFPDKHSPIKGNAGVENLPKKITSVDLSLEDMKTVKKATNATINDVLLGVVSAGLSRYLHQRDPQTRPNKYSIHASALVNTRKSPGLQELADMMTTGTRARWGNQMGYILIPLPLGSNEDILEYVRLAKAVSDRKKLSLEAPFTYRSGTLLMKVAGVKAASDLTYQTLLHSTLAISNVMGPVEQVAFCGNPITNITPTVVGQPQALCMHLQSYMGKATLVATVATDVIPDPRTILQHCKDALHEMKIACMSEKLNHPS